MEPQEKYSEGRIPVPANWEEVFSPFYFAANNGDAPVRKTLVPSFQTILVFSFGPPAIVHLPDGDVEIAASMAIGPLKTALEYTLPPGNQILVANFMLDAFYRLFGQSLKGRSQYLKNPGELVQGHCFSTLRNALANEPDNAKRVEMILDMTAGYLTERENAAETIIRNQDSPLSPVKATAGETGQSERNVQLNYQKYLGFSAKECHRHRRFLRAVELLNNRGTPDWFEVIDQCGFYDQSHLIRDFNHYLGISPTEYLRLREEICLAGG
ncbi:helix-turn-helix domain-containing protein [Chitinophaga sp. GCM10012297]|uniref:Helix-turn-helix transcriptional regulator n=1 Tax=Chitinophaga chungangae TaxID=2821488 RepID=A0ABS3YAY2_9BACT|nr:AraC family transcriptional regulator [Chitinophaga chungangae]MBO9151801.1 helix-turn-helix transcriptional regulator [Chitinophaga chungangae]